MTWYHYWPDPKPVGEVGDKKSRAVLLLDFTEAKVVLGSAQLPGRRILILPFVTALLEVSCAPMTSVLWPLFSEWRDCLPILLQWNDACKGLQENTLALILVHLFLWFTHNLQGSAKLRNPNFTPCIPWCSNWECLTPQGEGRLGFKCQKLYISNVV